MLVALAAGAVAGLPYIALPALSIVAPLCLVPLAVLAHFHARPGAGGAEAWVAGYLAAVAQSVVVLFWFPRLTNENLVYDWIMWPALLLAALYLGIFGGAAFSVATAISRRRGASIVWTLPAAWCLADWVRTQGVLGFPWGTFGYAWWASPLMIQSADLWGIFGLSFLTVAIAVRLAAPTRRRVVESVLVVALLCAYGSWRLGEARPEAALDVAVIQPNWGANEKWRPENRARVFRRYLDQSETAVPDSADLLVWPETATPFRLLGAPTHLRRVQELVDRHRTALITGTVHHEALSDSGEVRFYNAAVLFTPGGTDHPTYYKRYLVPFSEWLPWRLLRIMEINFGQADFTPGEDPTPLRVGSHAAGMLICIEAILPRFARASVRQGADFLVNITNDVWFGEGPAPYHHADMARFRAVELRRPIVRSANTGVSMLVDRTGRVSASLGTFRQGVLRGYIHPEQTRTVYAVLGDACVGLVALGLVAGIARAFGRGSGRDGEEIAVS
jgi:apolipoprotein N-acyltransferase